MEISELLKDYPVIAAVKDDAGLEKALCCESRVLFILYGTICTIDTIVARVKAAGKLAFVHLDLIEGLAPKDVAVDFLCKCAAPDGVISIKPSLLKYARSKGLLTVQRCFLLDSIAAANIERQLQSSRPDLVEILPGLMTAAIASVAAAHPKVPIIAGGMIKTKEDVYAALSAGAAAVSSTNPAVWAM
ncbi:MAG: glycerol-3-phosphate responsive antiterminator [Pygmaiobacter sp.]